MTIRRFPADSDLWLPDAPTLDLWQELQPGTPVTIVKRDIDGDESARYPGRVSRHVADPWRGVIATWTMQDVSQGGLTFATGDTLVEWFSPRHPYNAFAVSAPGGEFKGWYANIAWPAFLEATGDGLLLTWQDLLLDVVILPDGTMQDLDEEELDKVARTPEFVDALLEARSTVRTCARTHQVPFLLPSSAPRAR